MENKRRKSRAKVSKSSKEDKKPSPKVTFETFFFKCVIEGKLKSWQRKEIAAFFKDMKLKDKEDSEVYEEMLKRY